MEEQCEHAKANVAMVANVQSMMHKREDTKDARGFERMICREADKAKAELTRQGG